ncbi:DUF664 domain-containing protein [bacterium]|nr:DUF664 domain-containing protein [bacterium]
MPATAQVQLLKQSLQFFSRTCRVFKDEDARYAPVPGQLTVAQHVAHVAQTVDWFVEGAFRPSGFDLDFAAHHAAVRRVESLPEAYTWLARSVDAAASALGSRNEAELTAPIADGPILGGEPRVAIIGAICEHMAHHRGALSVYARLLGYAPPMPYGE